MSTSPVTTSPMTTSPMTTVSVSLTNDISSEDSNIFTIFQSFDGPIINPQKELSVIFANIETILKDDFPIISKQYTALSMIYDLILCLISLVDLHGTEYDIFDDFIDYYHVKIDMILKSIICNREITKLLYNLNSDINISMFSIVSSLISLIYKFNCQSFDETSAFHKSNYSFPISSSTTIKVITRLQSSLFKHSNKDHDSSLIQSSNEIRPCIFFRGEIGSSFIIREKLDLILKCLQTVLSNCDVDCVISNHFQGLLVNPPVYFDRDMYCDHINIVIERLNEQEMELMKPVMKLVLVLVLALAQPPPTVKKLPNFNPNVSINNYKYHLNQDWLQDPQFGSLSPSRDSLSSRESFLSRDSSNNQSQDISYSSYKPNLGFRHRFRLAFSQWRW